MNGKLFARITGTGSALPRTVVGNDYFAGYLDTTSEWIVIRTGIRKRHLAKEGETTASLGRDAACQALQNAGRRISDIDLMVVATSTPDRIFPSTACLIQKEFGIIADCPAFDVQAVCCGFVYALDIARKYVETGESKCALVIGTEVFSRILDWDDRSTCVLFGDGAGAVLLESSDKPGIIACKLHAAGEYADALFTPACYDPCALLPRLKMDGPEVYKFAVKALTEVAQSVVEKAGMTLEDIDWMLPHQANLRIIEKVAQNLCVPLEKTIISVAEHGNTSAASIPLALDLAVSQARVHKGDTLLVEAIGGGFTWGAMVIRY